MKNDKEILIPLVKEIFYEECLVYIDSTEDSGKFMVEIHFDDCNYYELKFKENDSKEEIIENILHNLVLERFKNLQNTDVNWNNIRYSREKG